MTGNGVKMDPHSLNSRVMTTIRHFGTPNLVISGLYAIKTIMKMLNSPLWTSVSVRALSNNNNNNSKRVIAACLQSEVRGHGVNVLR